MTDYSEVVIKLGLIKEGEAPIYRHIPCSELDLKNPSGITAVENLKKLAVLMLGRKNDSVKNVDLSFYHVDLTYNDTDDDKVLIFTNGDIMSALKEYIKVGKVKMLAEISSVDPVDLVNTESSSESVPSESVPPSPEVPFVHEIPGVTTTESSPNLNHPLAAMTPFPNIHPSDSPVETDHNDNRNSIRATTAAMESIPKINLRRTSTAATATSLVPELNPSVITNERYDNDQMKDKNKNDQNSVNKKIQKQHAFYIRLQNWNATPEVKNIVGSIYHQQQQQQQLTLNVAHMLEKAMKEYHIRIQRYQINDSNDDAIVNPHYYRTIHEAASACSVTPRKLMSVLLGTKQSHKNQSWCLVQITKELADQENNEIIKRQESQQSKTTDTNHNDVTFPDEIQNWNASQKVKDIFYHIYQSKCKNHVRCIPEILRIASFEYGIRIEQYHIEKNDRKGSCAYKTIKQAHERSNVHIEVISNMLRGTNRRRQLKRDRNFSWRFIQVKEGKNDKRKKQSASSAAAANVTKKMRVMDSSGNDSNDDPFYHELQSWNADQEVKDLLYKLYQLKDRNIQHMFMAAYKDYNLRLQQYDTKTNDMIGLYPNITEAYKSTENNKENIKALLRGKSEQLPFPKCCDRRYSWRYVLVKNDDDEGILIKPEEIDSNNVSK